MNMKRLADRISLPRVYERLLEIPVSLPDDDLLERLGANNVLACKVWEEILRQTHSRGELFTLQLHPERILIFKEAITSLLQSTRELFPRVWIPRLSEIYDWWEEKKGFSIELNVNQDGVYEVKARCSPRGTILARSNGFKDGKFYDGFQIINQRRFLIKSEKRPVIGIPVESPRELVEFLTNEGFIFETGDERERYSVYLDTFKTFSGYDETKALRVIHSTNSPLIRFWRWPAGYKSALTITGDIDALTSMDFFLRLFA